MALRKARSLRQDFDNDMIMMISRTRRVDQHALHVPPVHLVLHVCRLSAVMSTHVVVFTSGVSEQDRLSGAPRNSRAHKMYDRPSPSNVGPRESTTKLFATLHRYRQLIPLSR